MYPIHQGYYLPGGAYVAPQGYYGGGQPVGEQLAPQGFFGGALGGLAGRLGGGAIGGLFGQKGRDIGQTIGSAVGGIAGALLPFQADPSGAGAQAAQQPLTILLPSDAADPESEARHAFLQNAGRALIQSLEKYLSGNAAQNPQLNDCIPLAQRAVELFASRDYAGAVEQTFQTYRAIALLRSKNSNIPSP